MLILIHSVIIAVFVLLGLLFSAGKGAGLIAGYNTSSPQKKAKYDEKALCRFMGRFMFVLAACWVLALLSAVSGRMALLWIGQALFIVIIITGVIYANTGNRFKK